MKKRTKKLLSLLLAASMVLGMNTIAFAEEVTIDAVDEAVVTVDDVAEDAAVDNAEATLDDAEAVLTEDSATQKVTVSSDVTSWYAYDSYDEDVNFMAPYFLGVQEASEKKTIESDHLVNGDKVPVSYNAAVEGGYVGSIVQPGGHWDNKEDKYVYDGSADWRNAVSSNVFKLENGKYLMVAYTLGTDWVNHDNGSDKQVPLAYFNGKKFVDTSKIKFNKDGTVKFDKSQNPVIRVEAALVTQESGKAPVLVANSLSANSKGKKLISVTVKPKNNQYASVSSDATINNGHVDITAENEYTKEGTYPYFTISVKFDKDLNAYKKLLNKATGQKGKTLTKEEFRFDIARNYFAQYYATPVISGNDVDGSRHGRNREYSENTGFRHTYLAPGIDEGLAGDEFIRREIATDADKDGNANNEVGELALYTDAKKVGKNDIKVYVVNGAGDETQTSSGTGWDHKGVYSQYTLKNKKDYTVDTSLGTDILLLKPAGNFEGDGAVFRNATYTIPAGYSTDYKKEKKITEVRAGVYSYGNSGAYPEAEGKWYVDSVED